jgi:hypothetical protein
MRRHRPEYLYFSPIWLDLAGLAGAITVVGAICFTVIQTSPEIGIFPQRLRAAAVGTIEPDRVYAVMEPALDSSDITEADIAAIGWPSNEAIIAPIDRSLKGDAFWAAQKARIEAITASLHERWARRARGEADELGVAARAQRQLGPESSTNSAAPGRISSP